MTDREKLIALIGEALHRCFSVLCKDCKEFGEDVQAGDRVCQQRLFADYLLANGVVVREKGEWQYTEDIDEDGNIQAYCSACGAGDKHATSMVGKVPYCWKCGADMRRRENG